MLGYQTNEVDSIIKWKIVRDSCHQVEWSSRYLSRYRRFQDENSACDGAHSSLQHNLVSYKRFRVTKLRKEIVHKTNVA